MSVETEADPHLGEELPRQRRLAVGSAGCRWPPGLPAAPCPFPGTLLHEALPHAPTSSPISPTPAQTAPSCPNKPSQVTF